MIEAIRLHVLIAIFVFYLASGWHNRKKKMDTQTFIEYEVIEPISNKSFITSIREEALEYFENHCMVYEHHNTITQITTYTQSMTRITMQRHLNPTFEPNN